MRGHSLSHILPSLQAGRGETGSAHLGGARDWPPGRAARSYSPASQGQTQLPQSGPRSPLSGLAQSAASLVNVISSNVIKWHSVNVNKVWCLRCFRVADRKWYHHRNSNQQLLIPLLSEQTIWRGGPRLPSVPSPSVYSATSTPVFLCKAGSDFPQTNSLRQGLDSLFSS